LSPSSLRGANGSRERAPDGRLRDEAIHSVIWRHNCFASLATTGIAERLDFPIQLSNSKRRHSFAISPQLCASFIVNFPPSEDQRAQGMPGARCARSLACKSESSTHASHHGHTGNTRHSPRNGLRLISCSPRGPGSFAPVVPRDRLANLNTSVGVSGPHDFAVRFKRPRLTRHQRPPQPASRP
jgi:hypothetical protein